MVDAIIAVLSLVAGAVVAYLFGRQSGKNVANSLDYSDTRRKMDDADTVSGGADADREWLRSRDENKR